MKTKIYNTEFGSRLYGTALPGSDFDYVSVYRPDIDDLLLGKVSGSSQKIGGDDDVTEHAISDVLNLLAKGNATTLELLFSTQLRGPLALHPDWKYIWDNRKLFIPETSPSMIGYCIAQGNKYQLRGAKKTLMEELVDLMKDSRLNVSHYSEAARGLALMLHIPEYVSVDPSENPKEVGVEYLRIGSLKFPFGSSAKACASVLKGHLDKFGGRTEAAAKAEGGHDWKGLYHAVRVALMGIEYHTTQFITFPCPQAKLLVDIRTEKLDISEVVEILETSLDSLKKLCDKGSGKAAVSQSLVDRTLLEMYKAQR